MTMPYMPPLNQPKKSVYAPFSMFLWSFCCSMVFVSSRGWRHLVYARYASLWKSRACRASLPTISPPKLLRSLPGMPNTTESATFSRPAAGMLGMITQHGLGNACFLLLRLCHCYLSTSLIFLPFCSSSCIYPVLLIFISLQSWP